MVSYLPIIIVDLDVSVLENYHIAQTFGIMGRSSSAAKKRIDKNSLNIPDFTGII